jgi:hypothetical protein
MHVEEQIVQIARPGLMMLFEEKNQFAQEVALAESMQTVLETQSATRGNSSRIGPEL